MFLQVCVCPRGGAWSGRVPGFGGGVAWSWGVPGPGGVVSQHALRETVTAADGMHPTGMHSCSVVIFEQGLEYM